MAGFPVLCASVLCQLLCTVAAAEEVSRPVAQPVDVTIQASRPLRNSDSKDDTAGRFVISSSGGVTAKIATPAPVTQTESPLTQSRTLSQSRALMNGLRRGGPVTPVKPRAVPVSQTAAPLGATRPETQAKLSPAASGPTTPVPSVPSFVPAPLNSGSLSNQMQQNEILLTAGEDEVPGIVRIPTLDDEVGAPVAVEPDLSPPVLESFSQGSVSMQTFGFRQTKRGRIKKQRKGKLIEFYDPELERMDVDDYDKSVLQVGASDEPDNSRSASELLSRKLTDIRPTLNYAWGGYEDKQLPDDFHKRMDNGEYVEIVAPRTVLQWEPTNLWYHPLYFQDVGLERYGHTHKPWVQPFVSTGRFFGQVAALPYQMTLHPMKSREFALGYYQPGEWAPKKRYRIPFNEEAAATEFLWITGLILLIP